MNTTLLEESLGIRGLDITRAREYLKDKTAITQLGILNAWKFSFENLKKEQEVVAILNDALNLLYRIIIREQESSIDQIGDISVQNALMTAGILDYLDNQTSEFIRAFYVFIYNKDHFSENKKYNGYKEVFSNFHDKYGISINDYLKGLYVVVFCKLHNSFENLIQTRNISEYNFVIDATVIQSPKTREYVTQVLDILSFDYAAAKEWAVEVQSQTLDFNLFTRKPLYKNNEDSYFPICRKFIQDQLFNSLIYKIREAYDKEDKSFFNLLGFLFEDYVTYIFDQVLEKGKIKYEKINEFHIVIKKTQKNHQI